MQILRRQSHFRSVSKVYERKESRSENVDDLINFSQWMDESSFRLSRPLALECLSSYLKRSIDYTEDAFPNLKTTQDRRFSLSDFMTHRNDWESWNSLFCWFIPRLSSDQLWFGFVSSLIFERRPINSDRHFHYGLLLKGEPKKKTQSCIISQQVTTPKIELEIIICHFVARLLNDREHRREMSHVPRTVSVSS